MSTCNHPFEARETYGYAVIHAKGGAINSDNKPVRTRAVICLDCNTILAPDGPLVRERPVIYPGPSNSCRHEECRKELTQPYAIRMGECVACCLKRMRNATRKGLHAHL